MKTKIRWYLVLLAAAALALVAVSPAVLTVAQVGTEDAPVFLPLMIKPGDPPEEPPEDPGDPGDPPGPIPGSSSGELIPGGTFETTAGVGLGTLADTIADPITATISGLAAPALALPSQAQPLGHYFEIKSDRKVLAAPETPFIVAFPLPSGANTDHLALAVLDTGAGYLEVDPAAQAWIFLEGFYDASAGKFLTTLASLDDVGRTFVLVEHPDLTSPPNTRAPLTTAQPAAPPFHANCVNFTVPGQCTGAIEEQVELLLGQFHDRLQGELGFPEPHLRNFLGTLNYIPVAINILGYSADIEPHDYGFCHSRQAGGYYDPNEARLVLCLDPAVGLNQAYIHTLLHEYFHATQFGYPAVLNGSNDAWVLEGMAAAAEESYLLDEMVRSEINSWMQLHDVDNSIEVEDTLNEYFAQDFWVFHGQQLGRGLEYLKDFLSQGASTEVVAQLLGDGQFMDGYWEWAKNQVLEKLIDFNGRLGPSCSLLAEVAPRKEIFDHVFGVHFYQPVYAVEPLSSVVVEVHFDHDYDGAAGFVWVIDNSASGDMSLEYKFYKEGEGGCEAVPEGPRTYYDVTTSDTYYVLITNKDINSSHDYEVNFETWPMP